MIYIDKDYKCYASNDGTMREFDVPFFNDKCIEFIEGYYYVPAGEVRIGKDGTEYQGEQFSPRKDYTMLKRAQLEYENERLKAENTSMKEALAELGVTEDD